MNRSIIRIIIIFISSVLYSYHAAGQDFNLVYDLMSFNHEKDSVLRKNIEIDEKHIRDNEAFLLSNIVYSSLTADYLYLKHNIAYADKFIKAVQKDGMDKAKLFDQFTFPKYYPNSSGIVKTRYDSSLIMLINVMFETEQNVRTYYRKVINNQKITDPVMMGIDSMNFLLLDSFIYKRGILPADSLISYKVFDKLYLIMFHTVRRLSDQKWAEVKKVLDANLSSGILTNGFYASIIDQYYKSKNLPLPYGTYLHDYKEELPEINKNRRKIGLLSYEQTYGKKK